MRFIDLTGQTYGRLTVIERAPHKNGRTMWRCQCSCGNTVIASGNMLRRGHTKTCGCGKIERCREMAHAAGMKRAEQMRVHGGAGTRLYNVWKSMKDRCRNPHNKFYKDYGGRGIKVCEEWNSFESFREWAYTAGYDETALFGACTLDRRDNSQGYEPHNCHWVSLKEQANNRRRRTSNENYNRQG